MITFPTTSEAFIADQEKRTNSKLGDFQRELLEGYVEIFNSEFEAGAEGKEPLDVVKDTAEYYAKIGKLKDLENPAVKHFYACMQFWCREAWKQGAAKSGRKEAAE